MKKSVVRLAADKIKEKLTASVLFSKEALEQRCSKFRKEIGDKLSDVKDLKEMIGIIGSSGVVASGLVTTIQALSLDAKQHIPYQYQGTPGYQILYNYIIDRAVIAYTTLDIMLTRLEVYLEENVIPGECSTCPAWGFCHTPCTEAVENMKRKERINENKTTFRNPGGMYN